MSHNKFKRGFSCKMWIEDSDLQEFKGTNLKKFHKILSHALQTTQQSTGREILNYLYLQSFL